jgi:predicted dienelactone hydrolase
MTPFRILLGAALALGSLLADAAWAGLGQSEIAAGVGDGPVKVFYATAEAERPVRRGPFTLSLALDAAPLRGNGRLVMISHGSGGGAWEHTDMARTLVDAGFVVAIPLHHGDNYIDPGKPGPDSWTLRPAEISRAIDAVGRDARFAPLLALDKVGVYGMSAGGHTALTLAGGRWSPAAFKAHCDAHLVDDFQFCVGLITQLTGSWLDSVRKWVALAVIDHRFDDNTPRSHDDPRIAAAVAGVPAAAVFDMASLAAPKVPLGLVTSGQDRWLVPRFHSDRVLQACTPCERIAELPTAGHGALLSPLPPGFTGLEGDMLNDPPGFDRQQMGAVRQQVAAFFSRHLLP